MGKQAGCRIDYSPKYTPTTKMPDELYYATKAAYEEGYETAQQSCCEMMIRRERLLARWLEWARMHGHLDHAAGIVADTREILPPQFLPENYQSQAAQAAPKDEKY